MAEALVYVGAILAVAAIAWCWRPKPKIDSEPTETNADYDPLAAERAITDRLNRVKNGPGLHDGQEL